MKQSNEFNRNPGCSTLMIGIGLLAMDRPATYELAYKRGGEKTLESVVDFFEQGFKQLPREVIDNPEKVSQMRDAIEEHYTDETEQLLKSAALKVAKALENRLEVKSILTKEPGDPAKKEALIHYCVSVGEALKATTDIPRVLSYAMPVIRDVAMRLEINRFGAPQEVVNFDLAEDVVNLVK